MQLTIDANALTLADVEAVEEVTGQPLAVIFSGDSLTAKALSALVWVTQRRVDPAFTLDDARALRLSDVDIEATELPFTEGDG